MSVKTAPAIQCAHADIFYRLGPPGQPATTEGWRRGVPDGAPSPARAESWRTKRFNRLPSRFRPSIARRGEGAPTVPSGPTRRLFAASRPPRRSNPARLLEANGDVCDSSDRGVETCSEATVAVQQQRHNLSMAQGAEDGHDLVPHGLG